MANLAQPGGNITGFTLLAPELSAKRLELLHQLAPGTSRVAALWDPTTGKAQVTATENAAHALNLKLQILEVRNRDDVAGAFRAARDERAAALTVFASPVLASLNREIIDLAAENKLPAIYQWREAVEAGGLLSYGADLASMWRQSGVIVGRILKGEKPSDLPVEQPAKFELAVNSNTAPSLALPIPPHILVRIACGFGLILARRKLLSKHLLRPALLARCTFDCINIFSFVIALVHIDLAEIYAILLTSPFLTTILAVLFLKERVGWRRWFAIMGGFAGSLLIIKPSTHGFNYWAALGLLAALTSALRDFATTKIHPATSTFEVTFISAVFAAAAGFLFGIGQTWEPIIAYDAYLLVALAIASLTGTVLLIHACRIGPLYVAAAFRFTLLVWGGIAGYFVFGNIPDFWSLLGAAIIVICALYVFYREAIRQQPIASAMVTRG